MFTADGPVGGVGARGSPFGLSLQLVGGAALVAGLALGQPGQAVLTSAAGGLGVAASARWPRSAAPTLVVLLSAADVAATARAALPAALAGVSALILLLGTDARGLPCEFPARQWLASKRPLLTGAGVTAAAAVLASGWDWVGGWWMFVVAVVAAAAVYLLAVRSLTGVGHR